ncbi:hypothetical protein ACH4UM_38170 [Streptomyces sp. NPDC020801]|uniref:hypothetical protein n=1 Tax=unclassified Streptomyces TaxID=2593676 RepID=UPI0037AAE74E
MTPHQDVVELILRDHRHCREELGAGFARTEADLLTARCGSVANVHRMVHAAAPA